VIVDGYNSYKWIRSQYPKTSETLVFENICDSAYEFKSYSEELHTDEDIIKVAVMVNEITEKMHFGIKFKNPDVWISEFLPMEKYPQSAMYMPAIENIIRCYQMGKRLEAEKGL
jgi:hypothetical protein